jgi:hypothetical protein
LGALMEDVERSGWPDAHYARLLRTAGLTNLI